MSGKKTTNTDNNAGLTRGVLVAYAILALHVLLIAGIAVLVLFFRGIVNYMLWIMLGGLGIVGVSAFLLIRRMRAEKRSLQDLMRNPIVNGRSVEISLLGGMATVRLSSPSALQTLGYDPIIDVPLLEHPEAPRISDVSQLAELARLLEKDLITPDEFNEAKRRLLNS